MKRLIFAAAVTAIALAGAGVTRGEDAPQGYAPALNADGLQLAIGITARQKAANRSAVREFRQACESEREALCGDTANDSAALRCIAYHRLRVSSSCKQALTQVDLALRGAL